MMNGEIVARRPLGHLSLHLTLTLTLTTDANPNPNVSLPSVYPNPDPDQARGLGRLDVRRLEAALLRLARHGEEGATRGVPLRQALQHVGELGAAVQVPVSAPEGPRAGREKWVKGVNQVVKRLWDGKKRQRGLVETEGTLRTTELEARGAGLLLLLLLARTCPCSRSWI